MCIINNDFLYFGRKLSDLLFIFAADMKLQKLLRKCDFDRMFEYIVKFDSKTDMPLFAMVKQLSYCIQNTLSCCKLSNLYRLNIYKRCK